MTFTKQAFATLTVLAASVAFTSPAQATTLRHCENLAYTLYHQTIDYARWLTSQNAILAQRSPRTPFASFARWERYSKRYYLATARINKCVKRVA